MAQNQTQVQTLSPRLSLKVSLSANSVKDHQSFLCTAISQNCASIMLPGAIGPEAEFTTLVALGDSDL